MIRLTQTAQETFDGRCWAVTSRQHSGAGLVCATRAAGQNIDVPKAVCLNELLESGLRSGSCWLFQNLSLWI